MCSEMPTFGKHSSNFNSHSGYQATPHNVLYAAMPGGDEHEYTSPCFSMRAVITWRIELSHLPSHVDRAFTNSVDPKLSAEFSTHSRNRNGLDPTVQASSGVQAPHLEQT